MRPGTEVAVSVAGSNGAPIEGAEVTIERVDGAHRVKIVLEKQ